MNANEISPNANNFRLDRIKKASKSIRLFLQYGYPLIIITAIVSGCWEGTHLTDPPKLSNSSELLYFIAKFGVFVLFAILYFAVCLFWYWAALKLFGFFERGVLFTAETVRSIQFLGGTYVASFLVEFGLCFFNPMPDAVRTSLWTIWGDFTIGFLLIFIGWLIDEARKIREEQELTV